MKISVYIDNCVWDFLYDRNIDLAVELPNDEFSIRITREAEFEIRHMPPDKKDFAERTIAKCGIRPEMLFGFRDDTLPENERRKSAGSMRGAGQASQKWSSSTVIREAPVKGQQGCVRMRPMSL